MKMRLTNLLSILLLTAGIAHAQHTVRIEVDQKRPGATIPDDYSGLSFEMARLLPDEHGKYFFDPENRPLATLLKTLGVRNLRVGGNTADRPSVAVPGTKEIDRLFAFAKTAGVKVIYTIRLKEGDPAKAAQIAKYIFDNYRDDLSCLVVGNEPNVFAKTYPEFSAAWKTYVDAITAPGAAPGMKFGGPSTTPGKATWARDFAKDFAQSGRIAFITQHSYPGGSGTKVTDPVAGRVAMLSREWMDRYEHFRNSFAPQVAASGLTFRLEETNNYFNGGAVNVSNTFAAALWGLDYMHWWAAHEAVGLNFHTGDNVAAGDSNKPCRYAVFTTSKEGYTTHPLGYAMKAFDVASHGAILPVRVASNPDSVHITAYGVVRHDGAVLLTIINKEHDPASPATGVVVKLDGQIAKAERMSLAAPGNDIAATSGMTLGDGGFGEDGTWHGAWSAMKTGANADSLEIESLPATAVIVRVTVR